VAQMGRKEVWTQVLEGEKEEFKLVLLISILGSSPLNLRVLTKKGTAATTQLATVHSHRRRKKRIVQVLFRKTARTRRKKRKSVARCPSRKKTAVACEAALQEIWGLAGGRWGE